MRPIDQSHLVKAYAGKWVALKSDRRTVVASGKTITGVSQAAGRKGVHHPIITRVPKRVVNFIGFNAPR